MKIKYAINFFLLIFRRESGAMTLPFAIMFPMLLMFFSFALDGAHFQSTRARLADAMNQGTLAIAINDRCDYVTDKECAVKHGNKEANEKLLSHYLNYYLPNINFTDNDLDVIVNLNRNNAKELTSIDYNATGIAKLHPIFKKYNGVGFSDDVIVRADSSAGTVRKSVEKHSIPTDFVFIVDVSDSMSSKIRGSSDIKYNILKKAVVHFSHAILNNNEKNTIGIVPFNVGVPVKLSKTSLFGGKETGCSFAGKLKKRYAKFQSKSVDFNFWYNKHLGKTTNIKQQDELITSFYEKVVARGLNLTMPQMVDKKWCTTYSEKNIPFYSCDADSRANLRAHPHELNRHYDHVKNLNEIARHYLSIVTSKTINFNETLKDENLFSDRSVTTYTYFPYHINNSMFYHMCFDKSYYDSSKRPNFLYKLNNFVKEMKYRQSPPSYLIELTSNPDVINQFQKMSVMGGATDTSSGLLRSLPVIAKGHNAKKVIIMVTDGDDSAQGPKHLSRKLHQDYKICKRIKEGLLTYNKIYKTNEVDIFYISLASTKEDDEHIKFWREFCVGDDNAFVASDYLSLVNILTKIYKKDKINFIDKSGF
ncbi:hypothetical protein ACWWJF_18575 [Symbiopectobacterium sp. Eva_TO]